MKVLKFEAQWCNPCKMLTKVLEGATYNTPVQYLDIENPEVQDLVSKFNIQSVPTMVKIDDDGNEIGRLEGFLGKEKTLGFLN